MAVNTGAIKHLQALQNYNYQAALMQAAGTSSMSTGLGWGTTTIEFPAARGLAEGLYVMTPDQIFAGNVAKLKPPKVASGKKPQTALQWLDEQVDSVRIAL